MDLNEFIKRTLGKMGFKHDLPVPPPLVKFPFELLEVPGETALTVLEELRQQGKRDGFTAILLGKSRDVDLFSETAAVRQQTPAEILEIAKTIDPQAWFAQQVKQEPDYYNEVELGEWPAEPSPHDSILAHMEWSRESRKHVPSKSIFITKIPTANSWEVPAYLKFGNWNECPSPEHQVAIAKYWHERYGANIAAVTDDTIEFLVDHPPTDRDSAEKLAKEQFIYCTDIVYQGCGTLRKLAETLLNGTVWFFWWD